MQLSLRSTAHTILSISSEDRKSLRRCGQHPSAVTANLAFPVILHVRNRGTLKGSALLEIFLWLKGMEGRKVGRKGRRRGAEGGGGKKEVKGGRSRKGRGEGRKGGGEYNDNQFIYRSG